ncbi:MAG TPA: dTDP-4-dehydrorhamnose reductase [Nocardioides sp.]|jgi:dTDP-4-dehydrorhamnose reductase
MKWLVTGAGGMLGQDLLAVFGGDPALGRVTALDRAALDITDGLAVEAAVAGHDVVINAAGWTDVDGAETAEAAATAVNGQGPANLAAACAGSGAALLHVSTDYVFAGDATTPYAEDAPTAPANAYGRSKLAGERAVLAMLPDRGYVVRTAWVYGAHGRSFVGTILRLAGDRDTIDVVDDQRGQPTWTYALAVRLVALGSAAKKGTASAGIYHGTASGETTWFGLARAVFALAGLDPERIRPTTTKGYPRPARRPAYSVLGHDRWAQAGLPPMADWHDMLCDALARWPVPR